MYGMKTYVAGRSALEYWLRESVALGDPTLAAASVRRRLYLSGSRPARVQALEGAVRDTQIEGHLHGRLCGISLPIEVLVPAQCKKRVSVLKRCMCWSREIPPNSFFKVDKDLYVATPEFAFHQLAYGMSYAHKARLAYELCASYVRSEIDARGFRKCAPLSSVSLLRAFLEEEASGKPRKNELLVDMLSYVLDGSASPAETLVALQLFLPRVRGGFGLPTGELNGRVEIPVGRLDAQRGFTYFCDILWREAAVALEYDSDAFHTGSERICHDAKRRNDLLALGCSVITVTRGQLYDALLFKDAAERVESALGLHRRSKPVKYDWNARYGDLRKELFVKENPWTPKV